jgi:hypothetical protein
MTTSPQAFMGTAQFDSGRWKLRLEYAPLDLAKGTASTACDSMVGAATETESPLVSAKNENKVAL